MHPLTVTVRSFHRCYKTPAIFSLAQYTSLCRHQTVHATCSKYIGRQKMPLRSHADRAIQGEARYTMSFMGLQYPSSRPGRHRLAQHKCYHMHTVLEPALGV